MSRHRRFGVPWSDYVAFDDDEADFEYARGAIYGEELGEDDHWHHRVGDAVGQGVWEGIESKLSRATKCQDVYDLADRLLKKARKDPSFNCSQDGKMKLQEAMRLAMSGKCSSAKKAIRRAAKMCLEYGDESRDIDALLRRARGLGRYR